MLSFVSEWYFDNISLISAQCKDIMKDRGILSAPFSVSGLKHKKAQHDILIFIINGAIFTYQSKSAGMTI